MSPCDGNHTDTMISLMEFRKRELVSVVLLHILAPQLSSRLGTVVK